jgi:hypothetical protein
MSSSAVAMLRLIPVSKREVSTRKYNTAHQTFTINALPFIPYFPAHRLHIQQHNCQINIIPIYTSHQTSTGFEVVYANDPVSWSPIPHR